MWLLAAPALHNSRATTQNLNLAIIELDGAPWL